MLEHLQAAAAAAELAMVARLPAALVPSACKGLLTPGGLPANYANWLQALLGALMLLLIK
jgi:hypothetical protein